ncbi:MFS transporter [Candidatus Bathyarchaeota archaeon]|nr:MFS transporter [Candidatus Bathyarchaeota archaeon]
MGRVREFFSFFHGNILVLTVCRILWSTSTSIAFPYLSLYIRALGGSPADVGVINALGLLSGMLLYPVGGYIADLRGRVRLVGLSTYLYALSHIFYIAAKDWRALAVGQFLSQMLLFYTPAMNALMADSLPPDVRGRGFATVRALPQIFRIVAPYLGGLLIAYYGSGDRGLIMAMRICFTITLLVGLLVATLRLKFLKETLSGEEGSITVSGFPRILRESYRSIFESIRWMPRSLRYIVLLEILESLFVSMAAPFWVLYAKDVIGLEPQHWGTIMLISGIFGLLLSLPMGALVDRYGAKPVILISLSLAPLSIVVFLLSPSFWGAALALTLLSIANTAITPSFSTLIANLIPRERRGRLYALLGERGIMISTGRYWGGGFLLFLPASIGSFTGGYLYEVDPRLPFIILITALLASLLITYKFVKEPERAAI